MCTSTAPPETQSRSWPYWRRKKQLSYHSQRSQYPLSITGTTRKKSSKDIENFNNNSKLDITGIYKTLHSTNAIYSLFSCTQDSVRDAHSLGHKTSLDTSKKTEIIRNLFSDHSKIKLEFFLKRKDVEALAGGLSGWSAGLRTKGSLIRFPVRAHAWVSGPVPSRGHMRGNHTLMFLSLSFSLPSPL